MLIVLTGPTCSGKTTLALRSAELYGWTLIPVLTTRPPRADDPDTKRHVSEVSLTRAIRQPDLFRAFEYGQHLYATPILPCRRAAENLVHTWIIDWVHPHPEDLAWLGPRVVGIVLLPSVEALTERVRAADRSVRLMAALNERADIASKRSAYKSPWLICDADPSADVLCHWLAIVAAEIKSTY